MKVVSPDDAVSIINSGDRVFVHTAAAAPQTLVDAMTARADELRNVTVCHLHTEGEAPYAQDEHADTFHANTFFVGANLRTAVNTGNADYIPVFLSEVPLLFRNDVLPLDVALLHVSPPDKHGFCSLGVSVDASNAALESARRVVVQINPQMPRTHGDGLIHVNEIDYGVEVDAPLPEAPRPELSQVERAIGENCAQLVDHGATLQMGIGAIPDAVLRALGHHEGLGVHTEMFSDGLIDLIKNGVITGENKAVHPGKVVGSFALGTRSLYDFIDDNPLVAMLDVEYVNDTSVIRRNPKVTAINSAIEVDLTGQVCADSIGTYQYSGVGGQMDFIRGASLSDQGKPIIALPSTTGSGISRIAPHLKEGADVVTTRAHVHYIVTEYGSVNLYGKNLQERAAALINIAHPDHRTALQEAARERFNITTTGT
jgi:4-hydroxybutyrate CoA-transferase